MLPALSGLLRGLTFELRRDHRPGPGGPPLVLASNEGLGVTGVLDAEPSRDEQRRNDK